MSHYSHSLSSTEQCGRTTVCFASQNPILILFLFQNVVQLYSVSKLQSQILSYTELLCNSPGFLTNRHAVFSSILNSVLLFLQPS